MMTMKKNLLGLTLLLCAALLLPAAAAERSGTKTNAFFAFCIDTHDAKKRNLEQQAQMLKELGYDGVGHLWLDNLPERLKTLDAAGLKLFQITITVDITPGKQAYDPRLKDIMPLLKGRGVQFVLLMNGLKPSDPAGDPRAVEVVREMAALASESGAQVLLYPHSFMWMEKIEDAVRVAGKVDRPNVGVMFNLCHWLRVSKDRDYKSRLAQAMPRLWAISICGADEFDDKPGWARYIQPLNSRPPRSMAPAIASTARAMAGISRSTAAATFASSRLMMRRAASVPAVSIAAETAGSAVR